MFHFLANGAAGVLCWQEEEEREFQWSYILEKNQREFVSSLWV